MLKMCILVDIDSVRSKIIVENYMYRFSLCVIKTGQLFSVYHTLNAVGLVG